MSKDAVGDWSTTAANNTDIAGINIAEGMATADVNNAIRAMMAQVADLYDDTIWRGDAVQAPESNMNSITRPGMYFWRPTDNNVPMSAYGSLIHLKRDTDRYVQIAGTDSTSAIGRIFWREKSADGWSSWYQFQTFPTSANGITKIDSAGFYVGAVGHLNPAVAEYGVTMTAEGALHIKRNSGQPVNIGRSNDGNLISFQSGQTTQGVISVSSTTVTYGSFCGVHWSQFHSFARPNVLPGTILETIDEMCAWPVDEVLTADDRLARVKVADAGSKAVYGVFNSWDYDKDGTQSRDFWVASLGTHPVRMQPGASPKRGDLIEAGPDGLGVVQADDVFRSSTVAKCSTGIPVATYGDGSFLVPCTLHCG